MHPEVLRNLAQSVAMSTRRLDRNRDIRVIENLGERRP
jgi:hypothetical protein